MKWIFPYLWYVLRHKYFVMVECWRYGMYWTGIIHDWSKFLPSEFLPYARNFHKYSRDDIPDGAKRDFRRAWLHHQNRNRHHWQYWILNNDNGDVGVLRMPDKYLREMLADWKGAGRAIHGKDDTWEWYMKNFRKMSFHIDTRRKVERILKKEYNKKHV